MSTTNGTRTNDYKCIGVSFLSKKESVCFHRVHTFFELTSFICCTFEQQKHCLQRANIAIITDNKKNRRMDMLMKILFRFYITTPRL